MSRVPFIFSALTDVWCDVADAGAYIRGDGIFVFDSLYLHRCDLFFKYATREKKNHVGTLYDVKMGC